MEIFGDAPSLSFSLMLCYCGEDNGQETAGGYVEIFGDVPSLCFYLALCYCGENGCCAWAIMVIKSTK